MATIFSLSRLVASFRALLAAFAPEASAVRGASGAPQQPGGPSEPNRPSTPPGAAPRRPVWHGPVRHAFKPLRVVRVLEPSAPRSTAGRMVISGRLVDVCAELDRLAALEAQHC
jgi:hypothetical protein